MRVVLVGSFRIGRLAASYEQAFKALGHEVLRFDVDAYQLALRWWLKQRVFHRLTIKSLAARRLGSNAYNRALLNLVLDKKPDFLLAFNGPFIMPETVHRIRRYGCKFVLFHADNPLPPHHNARPETLLAAKECDVFLVWSSALAENLNLLGLPAGFLAFGWDEFVTPFQGFDHRYECDVSFIGGWDRKREKFLEEIAARFNLKIWGPAYWGERTGHGSALRRCWQGRALRGVELAQGFARTRINLNILRNQHHIDGKPDGVIMRTFEVPGAGGFLLSTRSGDATEMFPENEAAGYFSDLDECCAKIDVFLTKENLRREIIRQAHKTVDDHHHYYHRVRELLNYIY